MKRGTEPTREDYDTLESELLNMVPVSGQIIGLNRDDLAARVMLAILGGPRNLSQHELAELPRVAVNMADALLAELYGPEEVTVERSPEEEPLAFVVTSENVAGVIVTLDGMRVAFGPGVDTVSLQALDALVRPYDQDKRPRLQVFTDMPGDRTNYGVADPIPVTDGLNLVTVIREGV